MESVRRGIKWQEPESDILWKDRMTHNPHFANAENWQAARAMLQFQPREPRETAGARLQALRIHIRDHKSRDLPVDGRALEAHYGTFVLIWSDGEIHYLVASDQLPTETLQRIANSLY